MRVGLLINPIAGIGGPAGFKGSDADWRAAMAKGVTPQARVRAKRFIAALRQHGDVEWLVAPGAMGLDDMPCIAPDVTALLGSTTATDTKRWAEALAREVDLLCFVGGDGTAADIASAVDDTVPCLGIPAGVKVTSPVFAVDPESAGWMVAHLDDDFDTVARDVTDLNEESYRADRVEVVLKGSLRVPLNPAMQGGKVATSPETTLEPLVEQVMRDWDPDAVHLVGAGSVCRAIKQQFFGPPTLLGIDAIQGGRIVERDLDALAIHDVITAAHASGRNIQLWLSIIGGQGMLIGRGTQVLTPENIRDIGWDRIHVVAPPEKLLGVRALRIDTGDRILDEMAPAHIRVIAGWNEWRLLRIAHGPETS